MPTTARRRKTRSALCLALAAANAAAHAAEPARPPQPLPEVQVVDTAPLPGIGVPLEFVPANVQTVGPSSLSRRNGENLPDLLNIDLGSVNINDTQGNPYQPDVNFRGFAASPILGTPNGLSVFVDGVRANEAFGDTVNWDLIPRAAIAGITVLPGSNPVFGLNTLGGALVVTTKNGVDHPGTVMRAAGGTFSRQSYEIESGGSSGRADWFVTGAQYSDGGWGAHNPSRVNQWFAQGGWRGEATRLHATATWADTRLSGNQTLPLSMFGDPQQAYTYPDTTANRLAAVNLRVEQALGSALQLTAQTYYRAVQTRALNSNVNDDYDPLLPVGPGNQPAFNAFNNINDNRWGATLQLSGSGRLGGRANTLLGGLNYDRSGVRFTQFEQEAALQPDRNTVSSEPETLQTSLHAVTRQYAAYASDTLALTERVHLTAAGRYNHATVELNDQLGTALNGEHRFSRFNPAAGMTWNPRPALTVYGGYNEGMRIPTPVELTCADPAAPCSLPNAFAADPPLKAVIAKTWEAGARGRLDEHTRWNAAVFRTTLDNDIQFISSGGGATNAGYFQNVGTTRREGLELGLDHTAGRWTLAARASHVNATFESPFVINSPNNSSAQALLCATCTDIQVRPGNRLPGIPRDLLKLRADYRANENLRAGASLYAASGLYARGDENNADRNGLVPGYTVVNLDARWRIERNLTVVGAVNNLFNRQYQTYGVLGQNVFTAPGGQFDFTGATFRSEQFRTASPTRSLWVGLSYRFGGR